MENTRYAAAPFKVAFIFFALSSCINHENYKKSLQQQLHLHDTKSFFKKCIFVIYKVCDSLRALLFVIKSLTYLMKMF